MRTPKDDKESSDPAFRWGDRQEAPWLCTCVQTLRTPGSFAASGLLSPRGQIRTEGMPASPGSIVEKPCLGNYFNDLLHVALIG